MIGKVVTNQFSNMIKKWQLMFSFSLQIDIVTTDTVDVHSSNKDEKDEPGTTSLLLRMGPHRCENLPDILVECAINHPFFVKDKGQFGTPSQTFSIPIRFTIPSHFFVCFPVQWDFLNFVGNFRCNLFFG